MTASLEAHRDLPRVVRKKLPRAWQKKKERGNLLHPKLESAGEPAPAVILDSEAGPTCGHAVGPPQRYECRAWAVRRIVKEKRETNTRTLVRDSHVAALDSSPQIRHPMPCLRPDSCDGGGAGSDAVLGGRPHPTAGSGPVRGRGHGGTRREHGAQRIGPLHGRGHEVPLPLERALHA